MTSKIQETVEKVVQKVEEVVKSSDKQERKYAEPTEIDSFDPENHFYPKSINAAINSVVSSFFHMGNKRMINRYCHLNPNVDPKVLSELLGYEPKFFRWSGGDLFNVVSQAGNRKMVIIETNSCPSGQKSMPLLQEDEEQGGYKVLIENTFKPIHDQLLKDKKIVKDGVLAVIYDKNPMEASGYASAMADAFQETVYLTEFYKDDKNPCARFVNMLDEVTKRQKPVLEIMTKDGKWQKVRACYRYVTQKPWNRIPSCDALTMVFNPVIACLAGGRNKLLASKAYDLLNASIGNSGIKLNTPKTIQDVNKTLIPLWIETMGGFAVIKNPYSNAGQGVWTITCKQELDSFMAEKYDYDKFIVQSLIGNYKWSSVIQNNQYYHVGTVPDKLKRIFVADLRMMIHYNYTTKGYAPLSMYARRAPSPLLNTAPERSWDVLGTNLSFKNKDGSWGTSTKRLIVCAQGSFNKLGLGVDDLINAFIQTVLASVAIDKLCCKLVTDDDKFNLKLFNALNNDDALLKELMDSKFYDKIDKKK